MFFFPPEPGFERHVWTKQMEVIKVRKREKKSKNALWQLWKFSLCGNVLFFKKLTQSIWQSGGNDKLPEKEKDILKIQHISHLYLSISLCFCTVKFAKAVLIKKKTNFLNDESVGLESNLRHLRRKKKQQRVCFGLLPRKLPSLQQTWSRVWQESFSVCSVALLHLCQTSERSQK